VVGLIEDFVAETAEARVAGHCVRSWRSAPSFPRPSSTR
jgi:hypothetical protein